MKSTFQIKALSFSLQLESVVPVTARQIALKFQCWSKINTDTLASLTETQVNVHTLHTKQDINEA